MIRNSQSVTPLSTPASPSLKPSLVEGLDGYGEDNSDRQTFLNCSGDDWRDSEQSLHYQYFDYTFLIEEQTISRTVSQDSTVAEYSGRALCDHPGRADSRDSR